jgi:hypothetical protein
VADQPDNQRNNHPEIVDLIFQYRLYPLNILIFVYKPEDKYPQIKENQKF